MGRITTGEEPAERDDEVVVPMPGAGTGIGVCELVARVAGADTVTVGSMGAERVSVTAGGTELRAGEATGRCASLNRAYSRRLASSFCARAAALSKVLNDESGIADADGRLEGECWRGRSKLLRKDCSVPEL
jgi:hypothetical protein